MESKKDLIHNWQLDKLRPVTVKDNLLTYVEALRYVADLMGTKGEATKDEIRQLANELEVVIRRVNN